MKLEQYMDAISLFYANGNSPETGYDGILYNLLSTHSDGVRCVIEQYKADAVHKAFRQMDITSSPHIDMAIWQCFRYSNVAIPILVVMKKDDFGDLSEAKNAVRLMNAVNEISVQKTWLTE